MSCDYEGSESQPVWVNTMCVMGSPGGRGERELCSYVRTAYARGLGIICTVACVPIYLSEQGNLQRHVSSCLAITSMSLT